jgi:hypothetical protein
MSDAGSDSVPPDPHPEDPGDHRESIRLCDGGSLGTVSEAVDSLGCDEDPIESGSRVFREHSAQSRSGQRVWHVDVVVDDAPKEARRGCG